MPPILWAFFIGVGLATGWDPLFGERRILRKADPEVGLRTSASPQAYRVWSADASHRPGEGCAGTTFALSTRGRVARLQVDGEEQLLDTSWTFDWKLKVTAQAESEYVFLDPIGGAELACRRSRVSCEHDGARLFSGVCYDPPAEVVDRNGLKLEVLAPHFVSSQMRQIGPNRWIGGGQVTILVRIKGELIEKWWCPEVEVEWSDKTRSRKLADCDPWDGSPEQRQRKFSWTFNHRLGIGDNLVKVRLLHAGRVFTATRVVIKVTG